MASFITQLQREMERQRRANERQQRLASQALVREQRAAERAARQAEQQRARDEREAKKLYQESRAAEVDQMNEMLEAQVSTLESVLDATLDVDDFIDFESLKDSLDLPAFEGGSLSRPEAEVVWNPPKEPGKFALALPGAKERYQAELNEAGAKYHAEVAAREQRETERITALATAEAEHNAIVAELTRDASEQHRKVDEFRSAFGSGDPEAVVSYFTMVLTSSDYPEDFPQHHKLKFVPESQQLVVEIDLPTIDVVPDVKAYRYVKSKDSVTSTVRAKTQIKTLYAGVIAQVALRTLHEIFEADRTQQLETVVLSGFVNSLDPKTGHEKRVCLVTVRTSRDSFDAINLAQVEPIECLKGLKASVSSSPAELAPVRPVLDFDMVDSRFVDEADVMSGLDHRQNLLELSPGEFESLITNLFQTMGLDTKLTQASRDGGVDCVAFDPRPVFGGKVVIQAKRYKNTVGVSAVRDLFGTMQNEGASKGILVTTSGYGKASFEFADGKPLELLDGGNLLFLLEEHAGVSAKIEVPPDWVDPEPET